MGKPCVSVVLPVCNGAKTIGAAIRSIQRQTFEDWEMIVIDDGSDDGTCSQVLSIKDSRVRLVKNSANLGLAVSLNRGITEADGKFIARMDADDLSFPERLSRQYAFLEANPTVDVVGSAMIVREKCGQIKGVLRPPVEHSKICEQGLHGHFPLYHPTWFARTAWYISHPYNSAYRKAQDFELLWRVASTSVYANLPEALLVYCKDSGVLAKRLRTRAYTLCAYATSLHRSRWQALSGILAVTLKTAADLVCASPAKCLWRNSLSKARPAEAAVLEKLLAEIG